LNELNIDGVNTKQKGAFQIYAFLVPHPALPAEAGRVIGSKFEMHPNKTTFI
jgi:hypothetical protein